MCTENMLVGVHLSDQFLSNSKKKTIEIIDPKKKQKQGHGLSVNDIS